MDELKAIFPQCDDEIIQMALEQTQNTEDAIHMLLDLTNPNAVLDSRVAEDEKVARELIDSEYAQELHKEMNKEPTEINEGGEILSSEMKEELSKFKDNTIKTAQFVGDKIGQTATAVGTRFKGFFAKITSNSTDSSKPVPSKEEYIDFDKQSPVEPSLNIGPSTSESTDLNRERLLSLDDDAIGYTSPTRQSKSTK